MICSQLACRLDGLLWLVRRAQLFDLMKGQRCVGLLSRLPGLPAEPAGQERRPDSQSQHQRFAILRPEFPEPVELFVVRSYHSTPIPNVFEKSGPAPLARRWTHTRFMGCATGTAPK